MGSNIKLKNNLDTEFSIQHLDGEGAVSVMTQKIANA